MIQKGSGYTRNVSNVVEVLRDHKEENFFSIMDEKEKSNALQSTLESRSQGTMDN